MITPKESLYIPPKCEVEEMEPEGIIAESGINSDE